MLALDMNKSEKDDFELLGEDGGDQANDEEMQEFSIDELYDYGFFAENPSGEVDLSFDGDNLPFGPMSTLPEEVASKVSGRDHKAGISSGEAQEGAKKNKGKRRRQSIKIDVEKGIPPPSWHSEAADKQHRQSMVVEIARLLQSRKKTQPTSEWERQLPHKARKLEERLYRTAPSLEAYLDRTTLKNRLRRVATVITRQYRNAKLQQRFSHRSSASSTGTLSSFGSFAQSHRDSVTSVQSVDSLRSLQKSFNQKASFPSTVSSSQTDKTAGEAKKAPTATASSSANGITVKQAPESRGTIHASTSLGISELEQQKAVNEKLQQQIMENIRKQEELVRTLQARAQANSEQNGTTNKVAQVSNASGGTSTESSLNQGTSQYSSLSRSTSQTQSLLSNQQMASTQQPQNMLNLSLAQARLNPTLMAQAALLNQNRGLAPIIQNQLQLGGGGFTAANVIMNNSNLLQQQPLGMTGQHSDFRALQLQRLAAHNLEANQNFLASLHQQAQQPAPAPNGASQTTAANRNDSHAPMPPPLPSSQQRQTSSSSNPKSESKDPPSLSPGSFAW